MDTYLNHSGIHGMRWGVRRFQNEDGSLTEEGKRRYGRSDDGSGSKETKPYNSFTDLQKKQYDKLDPNVQKRLDKKMSKGKSFSEAKAEIDKEDKWAHAGMAVAGLGILVGNAAVRAFTARALLQGTAKMTVKALKSNTTKKAILHARKFLNRVAMKKAGGIVLNKKNYSILG